MTKATMFPSIRLSFCCKLTKELRTYVFSMRTDKSDAQADLILCRSHCWLSHSAASIVKPFDYRYHCAN